MTLAKSLRLEIGRYGWSGALDSFFYHFESVFEETKAFFVVENYALSLEAAVVHVDNHHFVGPLQ